MARTSAWVTYVIDERRPSEAVITGLRGFAEVLRSMATTPAGGAELRQ